MSTIKTVLELEDNVSKSIMTVHDTFKKLDVGINQTNMNIGTIPTILKNTASSAVKNVNEIVDKIGNIEGETQKVIDSAHASLGISEEIGNEIQSIADEINNASGAADNLEDSIEDVEEAANDANKGFSGWKAQIVTANQGLQLMKSIVNDIFNTLSDISALTDLQSRLQTITDDSNDIYKIQDKISRSSNETRSSFEDTANSVFSMQIALETYGATLDDSIRLSNLLSKSLALGGTKGSSADSVINNLNQSLTSGKVKWEDWKIVQSNSAHLANTLAEYYGVTRGELADLVQAGEVSAVDFANAMFQAGDSIDTAFAEMPDTFDDIKNMLKTFSITEFLSEGGVHDIIKDIFASDEVAELLNSLKVNIQGFFKWLGVMFKSLKNIASSGMVKSITKVLSTAFGALISVIEFVTITTVQFAEAFVNAWEWIAPAVYGVVAAIIAYNAPIMLATVRTAALAAVEAIRAFQLNFLSLAMIKAKIAQWALNASMLACPFVWVMLGIIALVVGFHYLAKVITNVTGETVTTIGAFFGVLYAYLAGVVNSMILIFANMITPLTSFINIIGAVATFIGNVFVDPIGAAIGLFMNLADTALGAFSFIASALDKLFGSDLATSIDEFNDGLKKSFKKMIDEHGNGEYNNEIYEQVNSVVDSARDSIVGLSIDYNDAFSLGVKHGNALSDKLDNMLFDGDNNEEGLGGAMDEIMRKISGDSNADDTVNLPNPLNVDRVKEPIQLDGEDIKLLKDVAKVEFINQYTTLRPQMNVTFGDVKETADVDAIIDKMEKMIIDANASSLVG